jgi:hypothetical protein
MAVLLKRPASYRERALSFHSRPDRSLAGVMAFVPPPRFAVPARSGLRPSHPATQPNSACGFTRHFRLVGVMPGQFRAPARIA